MSVKDDPKNNRSTFHSNPLSPTYVDLKREHSDKLLIKNKSHQQIKNQISSLNNFMKQIGRNDNDPISDDLVISFQDKLSDYIVYLRSKGLAQSTVTNSISHLRKLAKTAQEIVLDAELPATFKDALSVLVARSGLSQNAVSKHAGIPQTAINTWISGKFSPSIKHEQSIPELEKVLGVTLGTLKKRFPHNPYGSIKHMKRDPERLTEYRKKLKKLAMDHYVYIHPSERIKDEWINLVNFFSAPFFLDEKERNSKWRVKPLELASGEYRNKWYTQTQGGVCLTAAFKWQMVSPFLGFLILSKDRGGEHLAEKDLSLALLSNVDLVIKYINFRKNRSGCFTRETENFLNFCLALLREGTGYLRQMPQMADDLLNSVSRDEWDKHCEENRNKMLKILKELRKGQQIKKGRKPEEPLRAVLDKQHPIDVLWKMIETMEKEKRQIVTPRKLAWHTRDILLLKMLTLNPLRRHHYAIMTYRPDNTGNLIRHSDGSWGIHFEPEDFKNQNGAANRSYDIILSESIWGTIEEYLFQHRKFLSGANDCDYVFLSQKKYSKPDDMWPSESISDRVRKLTRRYIPDCPGFGPHGFRHIIATDYLKNNPNGYQVVATILHDKLETVLREYAHLRTADGYSHWTSYVDNRISKLEEGGLADE